MENMKMNKKLTLVQLNPFFRDIVVIRTNGITSKMFPRILFQTKSWFFLRDNCFSSKPIFFRNTYINHNKIENQTLNNFCLLIKILGLCINLKLFKLSKDIKNEQLQGRTSRTEN